ncbi:MAG: hypothetical protein H7832_14225 [Magnetococcus sp. DMHC-6]
MILLKVLGLSVVYFLLIGSTEAGFIGSAECNWFGLTIGVKDRQWQEMVGTKRMDAYIAAHCNSVTCQREPRGHDTMRYEHMPCSQSCITNLKKGYQQACTSQ